jgi:cell division protein FtsI/penicillin-binding protein 2
MKNLVSLALGSLFLLLNSAAFRAFPPTKRSSTSTRPASSVSRQTASLQSRHRRRRKPVARWSPWHVSSFGDPASSDNPLGEDQLVRAAAIEALGNFNGSVVVVDPNSGRILSIVNQRLALSGAFTPCSTFKPVVAAGALREGVITQRTMLHVGGRMRMNLTDALAHSNNMFFAKLGEMLGFERVSHYAHEFGLGEKAGLNIPGESAGVFPGQPPKEGGVGLLTSFGQDIEITSLQLAAILSAIANGGALYSLQYPRTPEELADFHPVVRRRLDGISAYLPQLKQGLAAAVLYGTARSAYTPDEQIFGKTGTCSQDGARLGWFASYSSEEHPKYVVVVLLRGGRMMFGPHAAEIAGRVYRGMLPKDKIANQVSGLVPPDEPGRK